MRTEGVVGLPEGPDWEARFLAAMVFSLERERGDVVKVWRRWEIRAWRRD